MAAPKLIKKGRVHFLSLWLPVALFGGIIFFTSSIPGGNIPAFFNYQDDAYHWSIYFLLALSFSRAVRNTWSAVSLYKVFAITLVFGLLYGASDEMHQYFTPNRDVSALDLLIDTFGAFCAGLVYLLHQRSLKS